MVPPPMPRLASCFNAALALLLVTGGHARAHAIPSLTVEAIFKADRSYVLKVNVDPRLFLSTKPTELPPVEASWYRDQTPEQHKATEKKCDEYLTEALNLVFSDKPAALPAITYQPMDGATNAPLGAASKEVHLLAEMHGTAPSAAQDFALTVGRDSNTSLILINSLDGKEERRPQVLFPGETSRPFGLPGAMDAGKTTAAAPSMPKAEVTAVEVHEVSRAGPLILVLSIGAALLLAFVVMRLVVRR